MGGRTLLLVSAVLALAIAGIAFFYTARPPAIQIQFAEASVGDVAREVLTAGILEPANLVDAGSQVSGTIQVLHADFNSKVRAGEVIARLDPSVYDAQVAQERAALLEAEGAVLEMEALVTDTERKAQRAQELEQRQLITRAEYEAAHLAAKEGVAKLTAARAAAAAAGAALRQAEVNRERTVIRSPIDGVVVSRNVEVGQTLAARMESPVLFRIADLRRMHLLAEVGEAEIGGVQVGTPVRFEIESLGGEEFTGKVAEIRLQPMQTVASSTGAATTSAGTSARQTTGTSGSTAPGAQASSAAGASSSGTAGPAASTTVTSVSAAGSAPGQSGTAAPPSGGVVSYTAVIDVENPGERIPPGSTAVVLLPTTRRSGVLRVPNRAFGFRPTPEVLAATGQKALTLPRPESGDDPAKGRPAILWKFEAGRFAASEVRIGASDENWTEILSGPIQAGDALVTAAAPAR